MTLPYDIARCSGLSDVALCDTCRRREPGHPTQQWYMAAAYEDGECPGFIPATEVLE
jgi:hypothetical protein